VAEFYAADVVVRITADCPFIDPRWIDRVVEPLLKADPNAPAFSSNVRWMRDSTCTLPDGLDVEAFTRGALRWVDLHETNPEDREHVCHAMHRNMANACAPVTKDLGHLRWVLDTPEDYRNLRELVAGLDCEPPRPTTDELLEVL
jgi:spore coat polysaccharide biosynthesis protein SpsF